MAHRIVPYQRNVFLTSRERERDLNFKFLHHIYYLMVVPFIAWHWCIYVPICCIISSLLGLHMGHWTYNDFEQ